MANVWKHRFRYVILLIGWLALTSISSNSLVFNLAQVCMAPSSHKNETTTETHSTVIDYTPKEISLINGALALGITVFTIPCTMSFTRYGMRWPLFFAGMLSALSTALMPLATMYNLYAVLICRVVQGIAYAANLPAIGRLCSQWSSLKQAGMFVSVLTSYMALSSGLTNAVGGKICESQFGWPMVYYAHAAVCIMIFAIWIVIYDDTPTNSSKVSPKELSKIQMNKTHTEIHGDKRSPPYRYLLTDLVVYVIWLCALAEFFITVFLTLYSPYYIRNVLHYSIEMTGYYSAISRIAQVPFRLIFGYASDKIKFLNDDLKLIVFNSIALGGAALSLIGLAFVPEQHPIVGVILLTTISIVQGSVSAGFFKCAVLYGRQYSQFIIGNCQLIKCATLFLAPLSVAIFVSNSADQHQWRVIFLISGIGAFIINLLFCKLSQASPASYTAENFFETHPEKQINKLEMSDLK
ncbi:Transporter, major facilitator family protein [Aphelenchoides besseyi]|nr:Transporter, major facilitator family protein [Aphelenchoides besseyi]